MAGTLVLLMGRSFSGKTRLAEALGEGLDARVVGYDTINAERGLQGGQGVPVEEWIATGAIAHDRAKALLADDRAVVVDDTSSPRVLRDEWRSLARDRRARFLLVHVDADEALIRRRLARNRATGERPDVVDAVLEGHLHAFEPPEADEPHLLVPAGTAPQEVVRAVAHALALP